MVQNQVDQVAERRQVGALEAWKYPSDVEITPEQVEAIRAIVGSSDKYRADPQSPDWVGRPIADVLELDADDSADKASIKKTIKTLDRRLHALKGDPQGRKPPFTCLSGCRSTADPQGDLLDEDGGKPALATVLTAWQARSASVRPGLWIKSSRLPPTIPSCGSALLAVAPKDDGDGISNVRLDRWLRSNNEATVDRLRLRGGGIEDGSVKWTLLTDE